MSRYGKAALISLLLVVLLAIAAALFHERILTALSCASNTQVLSQNSRGESVIMKQEICDEIAHSSGVSLELQRRGAGSPVVFFSYESQYSEPYVVWTAPDALTVEIFDVGEVFVKLQKVHGVKIQYRIGIGYENARRLGVACESHDAQAAAFCNEFIAATLTARANGPGQGMCMPQSMPLSKTVALIDRWMHDHPDEQAKSASTVVVEAMAASFPCK